MMIQSHQKPIGLVLAGGQSKRFGSPKAIVELNGKKLMNQIADQLRPFVSEVFISANADDVIREALYPILRDEFFSAGPLAGLHAAMKHFPESQSILAVTCDMPFLEAGFLQQLINEYSQSDGDGVCYFKESCLYPFPGIFSCRTKAILEEFLKSGKNRVQDFIMQSKSFSKLLVQDSALELFNMNTVQDYQLALNLIERRSLCLCPDQQN